MNFSDGLDEAILAGRTQNSYEIWDAHAHLGDYSRFFIPQSGAPSLIEVMDRTGVAVAVASSLRALESDASAGNAEMLDAVARTAGRLLAYAVFNPWNSSEEELRAMLLEPGVVGIKIHPDLHSYPVTGQRYDPVWRTSETLGVPVLSHTWGGSDYDDPRMLREVADRFAGIRTILGHSGATPFGFEVAMECATTHHQLYLEICGSQYSAAVLARTVRTIGAGRVLFGSDFPFIDQRMSLGRVAFSVLSEEDRRLVLGANARELFAWKENAE